MTNEEIAAIRERQTRRHALANMTTEREDALRSEGWRDDDFDSAYLDLHTTTDKPNEGRCVADIDALLAEVQRLTDERIVERLLVTTRQEQLEERMDSLDARLAALRKETTDVLGIESP